MKQKTPVPVIDVSELTFERNGEDVIHHFSFQISEGDYVGVIGPNGGGKTTLLRLLLGLTRPTTGTIRLFGKHPTDRGVRRDVAYVAQRGGSLDSQFPATVREVIRAGRTPRLGLFRPFGAADEKAVRRAVKELDIERLLDRPMARLSGGERQKVLLARALAGEPRLLILDEPTDGLDPGSRDEFYALLRKLNKGGLTIVFVSHDVHAVAQEAGAAICLKHNLVCHGEKACLIDRQELHNLFHASRAELLTHHDT